MTIFNPTIHPGLFSTGSTAAERLWEPDKLAKIWQATGLYDIIIQTATPAVADQGKIWFQPDAGNAAPGVFKYWNGSAWGAMTSAQWKNMASAADAYTAAATGPASPRVGDWWKNTSGSTVSGVPAGSTAFWNGTTWEVSGGSAAVGVASLV